MAAGGANSSATRAVDENLCGKYDTLAAAGSVPGGRGKTATEPLDTRPDTPNN